MRHGAPVLDYGTAGWLARVGLILALFTGLIRGGGPVGIAAPVYTLDDCLEIGLERAEAIRNAVRDEAIAETTIEQVRAQILPQFTVSAAYTRRDELESVQLGDQSMALGSLDNYSAGVSLRQLLYSGGSVQAGLRAATNFRDLTRFKTARTRAILIRDIRADFADLLLLGETVSVHEQRIRQLGEVAEQAQARFRQDRVAEFDVLNARVQLANAMPALIGASNDWSVAHAAFANLINLDGPDYAVSGELAFEPFDETLESLLARALADRSELRILEQRLALQQADIRVEQGAYRPTLHATAAYAGQDPAGMIAAGDGWDWRWNAGLEARWSLWDGGLRRHRVRQKQLEREKTLESLAALQRAVALEVRQGRLRITHAASAVSASRENVALAARALEIARSRYESGLTTRLEYTEVSLAAMQARLNWLQALREHHHAVNDLRYATGAYQQ